jgi:uncharacterized protein YutE (UPF0331/DUF86 family)
VVDEGRVARLLRGLADRVERLRTAADRSPSARDELWLDAVKYLFITAVEATVDVAQHIAASERYRAPDSNADALRLLGEHGVIPDDLARSLARAVGFSNVLVHRYVEVDDATVVAALDRLDEFDRFVHDLSAWMTRQR